MGENDPAILQHEDAREEVLPDLVRPVGILLRQEREEFRAGDQDEMRIMVWHRFDHHPWHQVSYFQRQDHENLPKVAGLQHAAFELKAARTVLCLANARELRPAVIPSRDQDRPFGMQVFRHLPESFRTSASAGSQRVLLSGACFAATALPLPHSAKGFAK